VSTGYVPIVVLGAVAALFAILSIVASALLRPKRPTVAKTEPYESGVRPVRLPAGERFHVKFYVVAMLFIIFDIETIFLIGLVFVAYLYVWQKGGLEWEGPERRPPPERHPWAGRLPPTVELGPGEGRLGEPVTAGAMAGSVGGDG